MNSGSAIYIATVLLEKNRWESRIPSFKVSEWSERFAHAGFDGIELWENHLLLSDKPETEAVMSGPLPVTVLNTYCNFDKAGAASRASSAQLASELNVPAVKFNFGNDQDKTRQYIHNLASWHDELPAGCRMLCECHQDTVLEEPENAVRILEPLLGEVEFIVHAFSGDDEAFRRRLDAFGTALTHIHLWFGDRMLAARRIDILQAAGFSGTWTIEFCKGVDRPPEDVEKLLGNATADLAYLREALS